MNKLIATLLLLPSIALAQSRAPERPMTLTMQCFDRDIVIKELIQTHKEKIVFTGNNEEKLQGSSSFVTYNAEKESFTVGIFVPSKNIICIVSSGYGALTP